MLLISDATRIQMAAANPRARLRLLKEMGEVLPLPTNICTDALLGLQHRIGFEAEWDRESCSDPSFGPISVRESVFAHGRYANNEPATALRTTWRREPEQHVVAGVLNG